MPSELINVNVELISLVDKGANRKTVIWKSANGNSELKEIRQIKFAKTDEVKKKVYGIVYSPNQVDAHGDYMNPVEIEKSQERFMKSLSSTNKTDMQHNGKPLDDVFMCETWLVKSGDPLFPDEAGAWAYAVKVNNEEIWDKVIKGELAGFSMFGTAQRIEDTNSEKSIVKEFFIHFKKFFESTNMENENSEIKFAKDFNALISREKTSDYLYALQNSFYEVYNDDTITDKKAALLANIDQMKTAVESIEFAKAEIAKVFDTKGEVIVKAGKVLSDANLKKLQAAYDNLKAIFAAAETAKSNNQNKDEEMTKEEIKKQVDDAVKVEVDKITKEKDDVISGLSTKISELEKKSDGSKQEVVKEDEPKTEVKKSLNMGFLFSGR